MTHALVAQPRSKAPDDAHVDDDPNLLNFVAVVSWIGRRMNFLP
jgi:hypothetical protein